MNTPDQNDVSTALALLRDSLAEEEQRIRGEGAAAMQGGDYDTATSVIEFAKRLLGFQKKGWLSESVTGTRLTHWFPGQDRRFVK